MAAQTRLTFMDTPNRIVPQAQSSACPMASRMADAAAATIASAANIGSHEKRGSDLSMVRGTYAKVGTAANAP